MLYECEILFISYYEKMKTPQEIQEFESQIDAVILQRGRNYYENGNIIEVTELTTDTFEAVVAGSYNYKVTVELVGDEIIDYTCDCPYDMGPICKHIVATLSYLKEMKGLEVIEEEIEKPSPEISKEKPKKPKKKRKTAQEKIEHLLKEVSEDDLKAFVLKRALEDSHFRRLLELSFVLQKDQLSASFYKKQIKVILTAAKDRAGFIDWRAVRSVHKPIVQILNKGHEQLEQQHFYNAFLIGKAVLEEMIAALNFADDSDGGIGNLVYMASDLLRELSKVRLPQKTRKAFFDYSLKAFDKEKFWGWDWHWDVLEFAAELFESAKEAEQLMLVIDKKNYKDYHLEMIQKIKYELIEKIEGVEQANAYLEQHIQNSRLRTIALEKAFGQEDYQRVIELAKNGIEQDERSKLGLANGWRKWLMKTAQAQEDREAIITYARYFFLDRASSQEESYQLLKQNISVDDWSVFVENLITDVMSLRSWYKRECLEYIYIEEKRWASLLELLKTERSFDLLKRYEPYLKKVYPKDLVALYEQEIVDYSQYNVGRGSYQVLCQNIRRIQKLGAAAKAAELIDYLRMTYPQRPALLDELNKLPN